MNDLLSERLLETMIEYGLWLPLTLTVESENRAVRMIGLCAQIIWSFPALFVLGLPLLTLVFAVIIEAVWRGEI